jgi:hypothetical protein
MQKSQEGERISSQAGGECSRRVSNKIRMQRMLGKQTSRMSGTAMQAEESQAPRKQLRPTANTEYENERQTTYSDLQKLHKCGILERQERNNGIPMRQVLAIPWAWPLHKQSFEQQTTAAPKRSILQGLQGQAVIYIAKIVTKGDVSDDLP